MNYQSKFIVEPGEQAAIFENQTFATIWFRRTEKPVKEFLKTTIIGGTSFLLPVALVVLVLSYALRLVTRIATPISHSLRLDQLGDVAGVGAATLLSVLALILVAFAAGIAARTAVGARVTRWSETSIFGRIPHYQLIKSMAEGLAHIESASGLKPALVNVEDGWQIGYQLEELENDWVAVFLPQAPTPMSGNIMYFPISRVRPLGITMIQAMSIVKGIGAGSGAALRGVDLTLPTVIQSP
jgi:uncharacterized membrane protein